MEIEVATTLVDILTFCKDKWYPDFTMVQYCTENNTKGLDFYIDHVEAVKKALSK